MDDVELRNIQLLFPTARSFSEDGLVEIRVRTDRGDIMVAVSGDRAKPAILTYHDLGLNCKYLYTSEWQTADFRTVLVWFTMGDHLWPKKPNMLSNSDISMTSPNYIHVTFHFKGLNDKIIHQ